MSACEGFPEEAARTTELGRSPVDLSRRARNACLSAPSKVAHAVWAHSDGAPARFDRFLLSKIRPADLETGLSGSHMQPIKK